MLDGIGAWECLVVAQAWSADFNPCMEVLLSLLPSGLFRGMTFTQVMLPHVCFDQWFTNPIRAVGSRPATEDASATETRQP